VRVNTVVGLKSSCLVRASKYCCWAEMEFCLVRASKYFCWAEIELCLVRASKYVCWAEMEFCLVRASKYCCFLLFVLSVRNVHYFDLKLVVSRTDSKFRPVESVECSDSNLRFSQDVYSPPKGWTGGMGPCQHLQGQTCSR